MSVGRTALLMKEVYPERADRIPHVITQQIGSVQVELRT